MECQNMVRLGDFVDEHVDPIQAYKACWAAANIFRKGGSSTELVEAMLTLAETEVPTETDHQWSQIKLLAHLCSLLHSKEEMSAKRQEAFSAARRRLAAVLRSFFDLVEVEGDETNPQNVSWAGRRADSQRWFKMMSRLKGKAVQGNLHPYALLNVGAGGSVEEAFAFGNVRAFLADHMDQLPREIYLGWTGPRVLGVYLETAGDLELENPSREMLERGRRVVQELRSYAQKRGWAEDRESEAANDSSESDGAEASEEPDSAFADSVREALSGAPAESVESATAYIASTYKEPAAVAEMRPRVLASDLRSAGISGIGPKRAEAVVAAARSAS